MTFFSKCFYNFAIILAASDSRRSLPGKNRRDKDFCPKPKIISVTFIKNLNIFRP